MKPATLDTRRCIGRESNPGQLLGRQLCLPLYHQCAQRLELRPTTAEIWWVWLDVNLMGLGHNKYWLLDQVSGWAQRFHLGSMSQWSSLPKPMWGITTDVEENVSFSATRWPSGQGDGLLIHCALHAWVRIPPPSQGTTYKVQPSLCRGCPSLRGVNQVTAIFGKFTARAGLARDVAKKALGTYKDEALCMETGCVGSPLKANSWHWLELWRWSGQASGLNFRMDCFVGVKQ